jgi:hypothetical protein
MNESLRLRQCHGKHRHKTMAAAHQEIRNSNKREQKKDVKGLKITAYHCQFCHGFHVGHK